MLVDKTEVATTTGTTELVVKTAADVGAACVDATTVVAAVVGTTAEAELERADALETAEAEDEAVAAAFFFLV